MQAPAGYSLGKSLHVGRHSHVYAAQREHDGREVVLKAYRSGSNQEERARHELALLQKLAGAGIPAVLELTLETGSPMLILERAAGITLDAWVGGSLPTPLEFIDVFRAVAEIVSRVHQARILHRDVNPGNILVDPATLDVSLIDFGQARPLGSATRGEIKSVESGPSGMLLYVSPEATGRMDRGLDSRSDLYSLGATMYFALTGRPPFDLRDRLAQVHAHMAKLPAAPAALRPELPATLSRIVLKLLQKTPEDRYQTAHALGRDLAECREQLRRTGIIQDDFPLASADAPFRPLFSKQLFGREREVQRLHDAYETARCGGVLLLAVQGAAGMGKSALIHELRGRLAETGGYLIRGKFDRYRRELPYSGLAQALDSLAQQLLAESAAQLADWGERMRSALGAIAGAISTLAPDLALVLGELPPIPALGPAETRARVVLALQRLLRALATREHPLVLVLDDLQWADAATRHVLREVLLEIRAASLLVVACYRDTEVDAAHPLFATLTELERDGVRIERVQLGPLGVDACAEMLSRALGRGLEETRSLAGCVSRKTGNSPLLAQQFIYHMYDLGVIRFEPRRGWSWDAEEIERADIADDAVALLSAKIARLTEPVARVLRLASCVGDHFERDALAELLGVSCDDIEPALFALCDEGLLSPAPQGFRFVHDRIREAARALIPAPERARLHAQAARRLLDPAHGGPTGMRVFEIADHLSAAGTALEAYERPRALEIYLLAAKCALLSGAAVTAAGYLGVARTLLDDETWTRQPALAIDVLMQSVESALQTLDFESAITLLDGLEPRALPRMIAAAAAGKRLRAEAQRRPGMHGVLPLILETLERFGVRWQAHPSHARTRWVMWRTDWTLRGPLDQTRIRPFSGGDPSSWLAPMLVMMEAGPMLSVLCPPLVAHAAAYALRMFCKHGFAAPPSAAFSALASSRLGFRNDVATSMRYAEAAGFWSRHLPHPIMNPRTDYMLNAFLYSWVRPRRDVLEPLRVASEQLFEVGDVEYGHYALSLRFTLMASVGESIELVEAEQERLAERMRNSSGVVERIKARALRLLRLGPVRSPRLDTEIVALAAELREHDAAHMGAWSIFAMVLCMLGRFDGVLACTYDPSRTVWRCTDIAFYRGIAAAALARPRILRESTRRVRALAACNPEFEPMLHGLRAERARLSGRSREALALYAKAADGASRHGFRHQLALIHERRVGALVSSRRDMEASAALAQAAALYEEWGASAKAARLRERDPA